MRTPPKILDATKASYNQSENCLLTTVPAHLFCDSIEQGIQSIDDTLAKSNRYGSFRARFGVENPEISERKGRTL